MAKWAKEQKVYSTYCSTVYYNAFQWHLRVDD